MVSITESAQCSLVPRLAQLLALDFSTPQLRGTWAEPLTSSTRQQPEMEAGEVSRVNGPTGMCNLSTKFGTTISELGESEPANYYRYGFFRVSPSAVM